MLSQYHASQPRVRNTLLAAVMAAACAVPAFADPVELRSVSQGGVTYVTGGIGLDEQQALEASARNYNLQITNSRPDGSFIAGTDLVIQDRSGQLVLRAHDTGPLFYAQLPPGDYTIRANFEGMESVKEARVAGRGSTGVHLVWSQAN